MNQKHLIEYIKWAYETACKHGFHDKERPIEHWLMLVITEVAEMVEADRKGKRAQVAMFKREIVTQQPKENRKKHWCFCFETFIKDTVEDEFADVCIRLFDLAGLMGWKIDASDDCYMPLLAMEHFAKMSVTERAFKLCGLLAMSEGSKLYVELAIDYLFRWAKADGIDLEWHIAQKMEYNEQRTRLHGKRY